MDKKVKVCAGIVTYNPDIYLLYKVVDAAINQVEHVFIFDNGSDNYNLIKKIEINECRVTVRTEKKNKGIAYALDMLCKLAIEKGYTWILTIDHDTIISDGMINSFMDIQTQVSDNVAIICPRVKYINYKVKEKGDISQRYIEVSACMTSGSYMSLEAYKKISGFDKWMFIDYVDNDICTQFRIAGYKILRDNNTYMVHRLGKPIKRKVLFWKLTDFQYSPLRIYYIIRNGIYFPTKFRKYKYIINSGKWYLICVFNILRFFVLYYKEKEKRYAIYKGIKHGILSYKRCSKRKRAFE